MGPIPAIAVAVLPELLKRIPEFAAIFSDRSRSSPEQYAEAASKAAEVLMTSTKADTIEGAIRKIDADPAALAAAREAAAASANELLGMLLKANEADEKSRDAAAARALREKQDLGPWLAEQQFRLNAAFGVATIVAIVVAHVFKIDGSLIAMLYGLFVMQATRASDSWKTIQEYRWGSSLGSSVKDEIINQGRK